MGNNPCVQWYQTKERLKSDARNQRTMELAKKRADAENTQLKMAMDILRARKEDRAENRQKRLTNRITDQEYTATDILLKQEIDMSQSRVNACLLQISRLAKERFVLESSIRHLNSSTEAKEYTEAVQQLKGQLPEDMRMMEKNFEIHTEVMQEMQEKNKEMMELQEEAQLEIDAPQEQNHDEDALTASALYLQMGDELDNVPLARPVVRFRAPKPREEVMDREMDQYHEQKIAEPQPDSPYVTAQSRQTEDYMRMCATLD